MSTKKIEAWIVQCDGCGENLTGVDGCYECGGYWCAPDADEAKEVSRYDVKHSQDGKDYCRECCYKLGLIERPPPFDPDAPRVTVAEIIHGGLYDNHQRLEAIKQTHRIEDQ